MNQEKNNSEKGERSYFWDKISDPRIRFVYDSIMIEIWDVFFWINVGIGVYFWIRIAQFFGQ